MSQQNKYKDPYSFDEEEYQGLGAGQWAGNTLGGAASGAAAGSVFGGYGTVIGGLVGAGVGLATTAEQDARAKQSWQQQQDLDRQLHSHGLYDQVIQGYEQSSALDAQSSQLQAQQMAAAHGLSAEASAGLSEKAGYDSSLAKAQGLPQVYAQAQQMDQARRAQVLNEFQVAQQLANNSAGPDYGAMFGNLAGNVAKAGGQAQANKMGPAPMTAPTGTDAEWNAKMADPWGVGAAQRTADTQAWDASVANPWGAGYPAPVAGVAGNPVETPYSAAPNAAPVAPVASAGPSVLPGVAPAHMAAGAPSGGVATPGGPPVPGAPGGQPSITDYPFPVQQTGKPQEWSGHGQDGRGPETFHVSVDRRDGTGKMEFGEGGTYNDTKDRIDRYLNPVSSSRGRPNAAPQPTTQTMRPPTEAPPMVDLLTYRPSEWAPGSLGSTIHPDTFDAAARGDNDALLSRMPAVTGSGFEPLPGAVGEGYQSMPGASGPGYMPQTPTPHSARRRPDVMDGTINGPEYQPEPAVDVYPPMHYGTSDNTIEARNYQDSLGLARPGDSPAMIAFINEHGFRPRSL